MHALSPRRLIPLLAGLVLAACNGTAYVTLTSTPAAGTSFLTYRVGLVSVELQDTSGGATQKLLPNGTTVDLVSLADVEELLGGAAIKKGTYTSAVVTVDYGSAVIVADDGTAAGVPLTPVGTDGGAVGQVALTLNLDPSDTFSVSTKSSIVLALDFRLAASNAVDLSARTVTVTPLILASGLAIDTKPLRLRGTLAKVDTTNSEYVVNAAPFASLTGGAGQVTVLPSDVTTYEVNGVPATGSTGFSAVSGLGTGVWTTAYGTWSSATGGTSTAVTGALTVNATQVLGGSSVQATGTDRVSGIVTARSADTLQLGSATWIDAAGADSYLTGGATVTLGANTSVTLPNQGTPAINPLTQVSVGSRITAFGTATADGTGSIALDASSGLVRLADTVALGLVTVQGTQTLTVDLTTLGGRAVAPFDFTGTGATAAAPSAPAAYLVGTGSLDLLNAAVGAPVSLTGLVAPFGTAPPAFTASTLFDPTTIQGELVLDWGSAGTTQPFATTSSSDLDVAIHNSTIGLRHTIDVAAQSYDLTTLPSDLLIAPDTSVTTVVYAIAHTGTGVVDSFNTFSAFVTALQSALTGSVAATALTAEGVYTSTGTTLTARSVTISLND